MDMKPENIEPNKEKLYCNMATEVSMLKAYTIIFPKYLSYLRVDKEKFKRIKSKYRLHRVESPANLSEVKVYNEIIRLLKE